MTAHGSIPNQPVLTERRAPRADDTRSDSELMRAVRDDDGAAMDTLVQRYWSQLVGFARSLVRSTDEAEDVAQETFTRMWARRDRWDPSEERGSVHAFLHSVARNLALNKKRTASNRARLASEQPPPTPFITPAHDLEASQLHTAFQQALLRLPKRRQEVFILARYHHLSYREIGEQLGISPQTVANHLSAALQDLRQELQVYLDTDGSS